MNTATTTKITDWAGIEYSGAGATYDWLKEQTEYTADLDSEQLLRLAMFAYNGGWALVEEDLELLIAHEEDAYQGEFGDEASFAEDFFNSTDLLDEQATKHLVIDWARTYDYSLQFDFFNYKVTDPTDGNLFRFFWNANV